jgi:hypothetical protein
MRRRQVMPSMFGVARRETLARQRDHVGLRSPLLLECACPAIEQPVNAASREHEVVCNRQRYDRSYSADNQYIAYVVTGRALPSGGFR